MLTNDYSNTDYNNTDYNNTVSPIGVPVVYIPRQQTTTQVVPPKTLLPLPVSHVWGIDYSVVDMQQTLNYIDQLIERRKPSTVITSNLNYAMLCDDNPRLAEFTRKCPVVLCDGMPVFWRSLLNKTKLPGRVAGADLILELAAHSAKKGHRVFLMGGTEGIASQASERLRSLHSRLQIVGVECPPFRPLNAIEHEQLLDRIRKAKPDILLVAFGQPKGEFWIEENSEKLGIPVCIQLGASFDFIAGNSKRAPVWLQKMGLEWAYRASYDPKRLLPRYAKNIWFLFKSIRRELLEVTV